jgi:predicted MFS family arabinose efflux permease
MNRNVLQMTTAKTRSENHGYRAVAAVLFLCLFAAQAGAVTLSPVLAAVARDLDVSTAVAGQLRTIAGLVAGLTAIGLNGLGRRIGLGRQLLCGCILLALGSLASAAAPGIALLALAQVPVGAGIGILTTAGTLATSEWVPDGRREATLSWALIGQPAAWIVGMPLVGAAAERSWRTAWVVFPLVAALLAAAAVASRSGAPSPRSAPASIRAALAAPGLRRWLVAEVLTNTAWAGTLVYSGALFVQSYDVSSTLTGGVLALGAGAYVCGNLALRRLADRGPRPLLAPLALALAATTSLFGAFRPSLTASAAFFAAAAFAAGGRTFLSSAFGLAVAGELRSSATAMRAASMQLGYFTGSLAAGAALAVGGYAAFGATIGALFLSAAVVLGRSPADADGVAAIAAPRLPVASDRARA